MKISADILALNLRDNFPFQTVGSLGCELVLERPLFWGHVGEIRDHQIYMANSGLTWNAPKRRVLSVLLCVGKPLEVYSELFETVLIFGEDVDVFSLYNHVQEIYSEHEAWDFTLQEILNSGKGVQPMIDCSERIFKNPLLLHNKNMVTIAYSANMPDWLLDEDTLSEFTTALKMDAEYMTSFEKRNATIFPENATGIRCLYVNIFDQGRYQYRLLANETERKLLPSDGAMLEHLAHYIQLALSTDIYHEKSGFKTLSYILKGIISGEITDLYYIEKQLSIYNWFRNQQYLCIKVLVDILDIQNKTINFLSSRISKLVKGSCAFEYNDGICVFVNLDIFNGTGEDVISELVYFLRDSNLKAGISNTYSGFEELKQHFLQSELALNVGLRHKPHIWIQRFHDIVEYLLLDSCTSQLPAKMLCAPELISLKNYDAVNGTEYFRTLYSYLNNQLEKVKTAKELYIHRSTFLYRLNRIHELTGLDIENSYKQWYLLLSFKLLEMGS